MNVAHRPLVSQVVRVSRLSGLERPLEVFYFVEGPGGVRVPAEVTAATMNRLDLQRAAIVLGHRVQRPLAQRESRTSSFHNICYFNGLDLMLSCSLPVSSCGDSDHPSSRDSEQQYLADRQCGCSRRARCLHHHRPLLEAVWL